MQYAISQYPFGPVHKDLFWNRGTLQLRSGLFYFSFPTFDLGILEIEMICR